MKKTLIMALCLLMASACAVREITELPQEENLVEVLFRAGSDDSKGCLETMLDADTGIANLTAAIYDDKGLLFFTKHYEGPDSYNFSAELYKNRKYTLFIVANVGEITVPTKADQMRNYVHELDDIYSLVDYSALPLAGELCLDTSESTEYDIALVKLAAAISLNFSAPEDFTIELSSVTFRSVPKSVTPFTGNTDPKGRIDGDFDAAGECLKLHSGESVSFLIPEDLSSLNEEPPAAGGTAPAPGITLPENIPYIEVTGKIFNTAGVTADIRYRVLLDYKLRRNTKYDVFFNVTKEGIFELSYRVDVTDPQLILQKSDILLFIGQTAQVSSDAMQYENLKFTVEDPTIVSVDPETGTVSAIGAGTTEIIVTSPALDTETVCTVEVHDPAEDKIAVAVDAELIAGQRIQVPVTANWGGTLNVALTDGGETEEFALDIGRDGDAQRVDNDWISIEFDPSSYAQGSATGWVTLILKDVCELELEFLSVSGNVLTKNAEITWPRIAVAPGKDSLKEDEYTDFSATMVGPDGAALTRDDFDPDLYDELYSDIEVTMTEEVTAKVWSYAKASGTGVVTALSAEGMTGVDAWFTANYTGTSDYLNTRAGKVRILPVFGTVTEDLGGIENRIFLNENGAWTRTFEDIATAEALPESELRLRHLGWDGLWENGTEPEASELTVEDTTDGTSRGLSITFGQDGSGPYAVRFVRKNPLTGREYHKEIKMNVYLMLECGPYVEWNELNTFICNVQMIWNLHPVSGYSSLLNDFPQSAEDTYICFSYTADPTKAKLPATMQEYPIGHVIKDWAPYTTYNQYYESAPDASECDIYFECLRYYSLSLHDPFYNRIHSDGYYYTDRAFAEEYYGGRPYLFGVTLHSKVKGLLYSICHTPDCFSYGPGYERNIYGRDVY